MRVGLQYIHDNSQVLADPAHFHETVPEEAANVMKELQDSLAKGGRAILGMRYADDAGIKPPSSQGFARMMTAAVEICKKFNLTVSERMT